MTAILNYCDINQLLPVVPPLKSIEKEGVWELAPLFFDNNTSQISYALALGGNMLIKTRLAIIGPFTEIIA